MGLSAWIDKKVDALSKGMAQKVQFIATVLNRPELLILDEPFSGLDPVNAEVLKDAVLELKRAGTTVVFSTHDMSVAERLCDRIFMIFKGKKVLDGTLDQIQSIYGHDTIRVRTDAGVAAPRGARRRRSRSTTWGNIQEVRWAGTRRTCWRPWPPAPRISHFEIARPSLHDIFVRIAAPEQAPGLETVSPMSPDLRKIWVVATTEFGSAIRTKSFIIGLLLLPMIMGASILIQHLRGRAGGHQAPEVRGDRPLGVLSPAIEQAAEAHNAKPSRARVASTRGRGWSRRPAVASEGSAEPPSSRSSCPTGSAAASSTPTSRSPPA